MVEEVPEGEVCKRYAEREKKGTQKGKYRCRGGMSHGGSCDKEPCKVALSTTALTMPPSCYKLLHCRCFEKTRNSMTISIDDAEGKNEGVPMNNSMEKCVFNKTWYPGRWGVTLKVEGISRTYYPMVGNEGYKFSRCLYDRKGTLWFIENSQGDLIMPIDAKPTDMVWINWPKISFYAQKFMTREKIIDEIRRSELDFHTFQERHLHSFEPLRVERETKITQKDSNETFDVGFVNKMNCWMPYEDFVRLLKKNVHNTYGLVASKNVKIVSEGARSNSISAFINGEYPFWKEKVKEAETMATKLNISKEVKERLLKRGSVAKTNNEKKLKNIYNCMEQCFTTCHNFPNLKFERPGICMDCLLAKMDDARNEFSHLPLFADGAFVRSKNKGGKLGNFKHFHSLAIACELVDRATEMLYERFLWDVHFRTLWTDLKNRIHTFNSMMEKKEVSNVEKPACKVDVIDLTKKKMLQSRDASYFLLNSINSATYAMLNFPTPVMVEGRSFNFSPPLWCNELTVRTKQQKRSYRISTCLNGKRFKPNEGCVEQRKRNLTQCSNLNLLKGSKKIWQRRYVESNFNDNEFVFNGVTYPLFDVATGFPSTRYFVAITNNLYSILFPENLSYVNNFKTDFVSKMKPAKSGDILTFDNRFLLWCHFDDTQHFFFRGAKRLAKTSARIVLNCDIYHSPDRIYFSNNKTLDWCERKYLVDTNNYLFSKNGECNDVFVTLGGECTYDCIPYQIKIMLLCCDAIYKPDVFCESLKRADLFSSSDRFANQNKFSTWDLNPTLKDLFIDLGYDCDLAIVDGCEDDQKKQMEVHKMKGYRNPGCISSTLVEQYHIFCAVRHSFHLQKDVFIKTENIASFSSRFFPEDTHVRIYCKDGQAFAEIFEASQKEIGDSREELAFYYSRSNIFHGMSARRRLRSQTRWGEMGIGMARRRLTSSTRWKEMDIIEKNVTNESKFSVDYQFIKKAIDTDYFSLFKKELLGSYEIFQNSKFMLPSLVKWQKHEKKKKSINGIDYDFFSNIALAPRTCYASGPHAFSDFHVHVNKTPDTMKWVQTGETLAEDVVENLSESQGVFEMEDFADFMS